MLKNARALLLALAAAAAIGCADSAPTPAAPTPAAPSASTTPDGSFTLSGTIRELLAEGTGPAIARARVDLYFKSGLAASATTDAGGTFSISGVAARPFRLEVSRNGYAGAQRDTLALTADAVWDLALAPIPVTVTGTVTETPPTERAPVPGAQVTITSGAQRGRSVTAANDGTFTLPQVWGDFDVSVAQSGFESATAHVALAGEDARLDVALLPLGRVVTQFTGTVCGKVPDRGTFATLRCTPLETRHTFFVHKDGPLTLGLEYNYVGDYHVNSLGIEIRCGNDVVLSSKAWNLWGTRGYFPSSGELVASIQAEVPRASICEVRLFDYVPDLKAMRAWTTYRVTLDHPR